MNRSAIDKRLKEIKIQKQNLLIDLENEENDLKELLKYDNHNSWGLFLNNLGKSQKLSGSELDVKTYISLRNSQSDFDFFDNIKDKLDSIPESNGSRLYKKINKNISIIADEFLYNSFKDVANLKYINQNNVDDNLIESDMLLVASTWRGLDNEWRGVATPKSRKREELVSIIRKFRKHGVPVVFFNKEDPVNFDRFIDVAKECDYVFTTAIEKVNDYKELCQHNRVYLIEFSVNPLYHNPIGMNLNNKDKEVLFTGSWYNKYPNRQNDTRMIFDGVIASDYNLKVIDRNFSLENKDYFFPEEYLKYISPEIPHNYIQKLHKLYNWSINLSSVVTSPSMIPNRVYELQAIGNVLISNYSPSINNKFQNVYLVTNQHEVTSILNSYSDEDIYYHQVYGIRNIMDGDTSFDRMKYILNIVGIKVESMDKKNILVVADELNDSTIKSFEKQNYKQKKLIKLEEFNDQVKANHDMVTFFSSSIEYEKDYLKDLRNGFIYSDVDFVQKSNMNKRSTIEYQYTGEVEDENKTLFWSESFSVDEIKNMQANDKIGLMIDHFEYKNDNEEIILRNNSSDDYELSVIVPVYNNGRYLEFKCFESLKRSSIFNKMEIIIVDDGSTDNETKQIIEKLKKRYSNVKVYAFNDQGSGSASRPRNRGVELSTCKYVTYLDPDNEAINDGYAVLLDELKQDASLDLVVGNILRLDRKIMRLNYYNYAYRYSLSEEIDNPKELLKNTSLRVQSIQALIVKKSVILNNQLEMVVSAAGQDSLFFQELLLHSKKIKIKDIDIHIYYANVSNSVTNTITRNFFMKYLKLEKSRIEFLIKNELLETYLEERFLYYFKNWYLKRVPLIIDEDTEVSLMILLKIYSLYEPYIKHLDQDIKRVIKYIKKKKYGKTKEYCAKIFEK